MPCNWTVIVALTQKSGKCVEPLPLTFCGLQPALAFVICKHKKSCLWKLLQHHMDCMLIVIPRTYIVNMLNALIINIIPPTYMNTNRYFFRSYWVQNFRSLKFIILKQRKFISNYAYVVTKIFFALEISI